VQRTESHLVLALISRLQHVLRTREGIHDHGLAVVWDRELVCWHVRDMSGGYTAISGSFPGVRALPSSGVEPLFPS
jgi:hypothetical protein